MYRLSTKELRAEVDGMLEAAKLHTQQEAQSMSHRRWISKTGWKDIRYPLTIPSRLLKSRYRAQSKGLGSIPVELLVMIAEELDAGEESGLRAGALALTCKHAAAAASIAKVSKSPQLVTCCGWQPRGMRFCRGCGKNRITAQPYWSTVANRRDCEVWADSVSPPHGPDGKLEYKKIGPWITDWGRDNDLPDGKPSMCPACSAQKYAEDRIYASREAVIWRSDVAALLLTRLEAEKATG